MRKSLSRRSLATALSGLLVVAISVVSIDASYGASCVPVAATGKTVGSISIGSLTMPIKSFNYPAGGVMEPGRNTTAAGLSARHMPLSSNVGSSILVWHRDYKGCVHPLNVFLSKKVGTQFSVTDSTGKVTKYSLNSVKVITKGDYDESWFNLIGKRQLVMVTCTGVFKSGHYEKNIVFIANPV